ncbi:GDSL esterase/lipase At5g55050-like [Phragmites australis]|uniref:GDSL esterase/lipase At5g55050-like n=1 Tax=Phragmites australis TaxID=29695 RepID=UPI002D76CC72|nr:GDSL esterase/lipase At5g55050-like [Phragmites australis]
MGATTVTSPSCSIAATIVAFLAAASLLAASAASPVPAVYVFGDSLADVGNNNHLLTLLKADFPHNGIDYPGKKATGRFSNGKNFPDFLADNLGLATSPPYLALSSSSSANYVNGVNFASGGAGVSNATNKDQCISFDKQIEYYSSVYASLAQSLGQTQAAAHLSKSLFAITICSNDIIHYTKSSSANKASTPSQQFVDTLIQSLTGQLQRLYNLGARKILFLGTGPVGCCPSLRELSSTKDCSAEANDLSVRYNAAAASLLSDMAARHPDMHYALFDASAALLRYINQPAAYGFSEVKAACCGLGDMNAKIGCTPVSFYCANRTSHVFWDFYHPTEATARKLTSTAFDGSAPLIFPMNIRQLSAM